MELKSGIFKKFLNSSSIVVNFFIFLFEEEKKILIRWKYHLSKFHAEYSFLSAKPTRVFYESHGKKYFFFSNRLKMCCESILGVLNRFLVKKFFFFYVKFEFWAVRALEHRIDRTSVVGHSQEKLKKILFSHIP